MAQLHRRQLEQAQYGLLKEVWDHLESHPAEALDDAELDKLRVVRSTDLDVDSPSLFDFESQFFAPCHGEISGLEKVLERWVPLWYPHKDPEHLRDDEWIPNAGYTYADGKLDWFSHVFQCLRWEYEGEAHPVNMYNHFAAEDMDFDAPVGYCGKEMYLPGGYMMPTAPDKPHMGITMLSPIVAPKDKMLESELTAAIACLLAQGHSKAFTNHHTKPVIVFTFEHETHARITQAHVDAKTDKIVIRQSRQLDVVGADGQPPADAHILLRWLLNSPVGATEYQDEEPEGEVEAAEMPVTPNRVLASASSRTPTG